MAVWPIQPQARSMTNIPRLITKATCPHHGSLHNSTYTPPYINLSTYPENPTVYINSIQYKIKHTQHWIIHLMTPPNPNNQLPQFKHILFCTNTMYPYAQPQKLKKQDWIRNYFQYLQKRYPKNRGHKFTINLSKEQPPIKLKITKSKQMNK